MAQHLPISRQGIYLAAILLIVSLPTQAQFKLPFSKQLEVEIINTDLNQQDTTIVIEYNLKGSKKRYYDTRLYYSNNRGNSFKGPLRSIEGDLGDSTRVGNNKVVNWSFRKDNPYFDGKQIMFKIEATEVPKIATGGPSNAFKSLLVPGLGDTEVRNGYNYGWIAVATYACLGVGTYYHFRARSKNNDYRDRVANTASEHNELFDQAERSQNISRGFFIAGASIWLADIIGVYIKGLKNRRNLAKAAQEEENSEETSFNWIPEIIPQSDGQFSQLSLVWRF